MNALNIELLSSKSFWATVLHQFLADPSLRDPAHRVAYICNHSSNFNRFWSKPKAKPILRNLAKEFLQQKAELGFITTHHKLLFLKNPTLKPTHSDRQIREEFLSWMVAEGYHLAPIMCPEFWATLKTAYCTKEVNFFCATQTDFDYLWQNKPCRKCIKRWANDYAKGYPNLNIWVSETDKLLFSYTFELSPNDLLPEFKLYKTQFLIWLKTKLTHVN